MQWSESNHHTGLFPLSSYKTSSAKQSDDQNRKPDTAKTAQQHCRQEKHRFLLFLMSRAYHENIKNKANYIKGKFKRRCRRRENGSTKQQIRRLFKLPSFLRIIVSAFLIIYAFYRIN